MEEFKYLIPEESIDAIITNVEKLRELKIIYDMFFQIMDTMKY